MTGGHLQMKKRSQTKDATCPAISVSSLPEAEKAKATGLSDEQMMDRLTELALNGLNLFLSVARIAQFGLEKTTVHCSVHPEQWSEKVKNPIPWCVFGEGGTASEAIRNALQKLPEDLVSSAPQDQAQSVLTLAGQEPVTRRKRK
jgi:hypothetical protein